MKTHNGFISNSSSTSFVILFPSDFDLSLVKLDKNVLNDYDITQEKAIKAIEKLVAGEKINGYEDHNAYYSLSEILKDFMIAETHANPDDGVIIPVSLSKIEKILKVKKNKAEIIEEF